MNKLNIIYRISDTGYKKNKPNYINNENCLKNFTSVFSNYLDDIHIIADNVSNETFSMIKKYVNEKNIELVSVGHGAGTFNLALNKALKYEDSTIVYFVENDYLHKPGSDTVLLEGFNLQFPFVSLYDHPDKYICSSVGGNPLCYGGAENTRVYLTKTCHWKITNSTTMTFASRVSDLKTNEHVFRKWTNINHYPDDFKIFLELRENKQYVITPIPSFSTHGEVEWLAPIIDWSKI